MKVTDAAKILTEKEVELGKTSEVWFTGAELIERGAAKDYSEYLTRPKILPAGILFTVNDRYFIQHIDGKWVEVKVCDNEPLTYHQLREMLEKNPEKNAIETQVEVTPNKKTRTVKKQKSK